MSIIGKRFTAVINGHEVEGKIFKCTPEDSEEGNDAILAFNSEYVGWWLNEKCEEELAALNEGYGVGCYLNNTTGNISDVLLEKFKIID